MQAKMEHLRLVRYVRHFPSGVLSPPRLPWQASGPVTLILKSLLPPYRSAWPLLQDARLSL